ncbi:phiSA1p31-related protein [Streptomyces sp900116325]|uniref:phiSA1p31-related protein n=1 Tax=Streptomyces sp. 900116325 TaxID=3154295 RepID=UPI00340B1D31
MTIYEHDGNSFDLDVPHADVTGVEWEWTSAWFDGEPLMVAPGSRTPLPLPTVYRDHGPLIPISPRPTAAQYLAAVDVDPNYADSVARRLYETAPQHRERMAAQRAAAAPTPVPTAAGHVLAPSPLEQTGFRSFIRSLRGGA